MFILRRLNPEGEKYHSVISDAYDAVSLIDGSHHLKVTVENGSMRSIRKHELPKDYFKSKFDTKQSALAFKQKLIELANVTTPIDEYDEILSVDEYEVVETSVID